VFGVDPETASGPYEFGCRILDAVTGEKLDENRYVFEVE
jgi:hypothetical protein